MSEIDKIPEDLVLNAVASSHIDLLDFDVIVLTRMNRYFVGVLRYVSQHLCFMVSVPSEAASTLSFLEITIPC